MKQACCFTGHRPQNLPWGFEEADPRCITLKKKIGQAIQYLVVKKGVTHFFSGMALGTDTWSAELVIWYRNLHPEYEIILEAVLPCTDQADRWRSVDRERYQAILEKCDVITSLQERYSPGCMERRNRYMVDHSCYVIAAWNGRSSGTGVTIRYAENLGKGIIVFAP